MAELVLITGGAFVVAFLGGYLVGRSQRLAIMRWCNLRVGALEALTNAYQHELDDALPYAAGEVASDFGQWESYCKWAVRLYDTMGARDAYMQLIAHFGTASDVFRSYGPPLQAFRGWVEAMLARDREAFASTRFTLIASGMGYEESRDPPPISIDSKWS